MVHKAWLLKANLIKGDSGIVLFVISVLDHVAIEFIHFIEH